MIGRATKNANPFICNTCVPFSRNPCICNTYRKHGGGGVAVNNNLALRLTRL